MAKLKYLVHLNIAGFDAAALTCATRLREKYQRAFDDVAVSLIAVVVADFADELRKELFTHEG